MSNDEQSSAALPKRFKLRPSDAYNSDEKFYLDSDSADVHFVFGLLDSKASSSARIPAHKYLLARDSDVFKAMFYGPMKENGDIRLKDVSEAVFKVFLQFFYLNEMDLTVENFAAVMRLGDKYNVTNCINVCVEFFRGVHNAENILIGLDLGIRYDHSQLMAFCERFIVFNTDAVLESSGFLECDQLLLAYILYANLFVCSERELFESCMAWVAAKSGHEVSSKEMVDEHLGELFYNIRYGLMEIEEFCFLAQKYNAVLSNDFQTITNLIVLPHIQQDRFSTQSREIQWTDPNVSIIKCDCEEKGEFSESIQANFVENTRIYASSNILWTGFTINKIADEASRYGAIATASDDDIVDVIVDVIISKADFQGGDAEVVLKISQGLQYSKSTKISLPKPILMKTEYDYGISVIFPLTCTISYIYHSKALKETVQLDSDLDIHFNDLNKSKTDNTKAIGIISALEFLRV